MQHILTFQYHVLKSTKQLWKLHYHYVETKQKHTIGTCSISTSDLSGTFMTRHFHNNIQAVSADNMIQVSFSIQLFVNYCICYCYFVLCSLYIQRL